MRQYLVSPSALYFFLEKEPLHNLRMHPKHGIYTLYLFYRKDLITTAHRDYGLSFYINGPYRLIMQGRAREVGCLGMKNMPIDNISLNLNLCTAQA